MSNTTRYGVLIDGRRGGYGVVFPDCRAATGDGAHPRRGFGHAMEAAGEWAQAVPAPRPRLLEALRDDPEQDRHCRLREPNDFRMIDIA